MELDVEKLIKTIAYTLNKILENPNTIKDICVSEDPKTQVCNCENFANILVLGCIKIR